MKVFKVNKNIEMIASYKNARDGFNHFATLMYNGNDVETVKSHYINRTWESYEFESVLLKLAEKSKILSISEKTEVKQYIKDYENTNRQAVNNTFKSLSMFMKMTDLFVDDLKSKNESKLRMIQATIGNGLILPDNWETIPEAEKETRLNNIQNML